MENDDVTPTNVNVRNQNKTVNSIEHADMATMHEYSNQSTTAHKDDFSFLRVPSHETVTDGDAVNDNMAQSNESDKPPEVIIRASRII